jgi:hypothetical protein
LGFGLSVEPARPHEGEALVVSIGGVGSCPEVQGTRVIHDGEGGGVIDLLLVDGCLSPPVDFLLEESLAPLTPGPWEVRLLREATVVATRTVLVGTLPFSLRLESPIRTVDDQPVTVVFEGHSIPCWHLDGPRVDGHLVTFDARFECNIIPAPPTRFEVSAELPVLAAGFFRVQVAGEEGETLASADLELREPGACVPDGPYGQLVCPQSGRFRVSAEWSLGGDLQTAYAVQLTRDTGVFYFFAEDNLEVMVKVLDACGLEPGRFWVFASGLTNLEVRLQVEDTRTGEVWKRTHTGGPPFPPILDTNAFATCDG